MVNGFIYINSYIQTALLSTALYNLPVILQFRHTLSHQWQDAGLTIRSNLGFVVFPSDTLTNGQEEQGIKSHFNAFFGINKNVPAALRAGKCLVLSWFVLDLNPSFRLCFLLNKKQLCRKTSIPTTKVSVY